VKAVVDTNVIAYLLLNTDKFVDEARECMAVLSVAMAPAHWEAELANVIWMAVRAGVLAPEDGRSKLALSRSLGIESVALAPLCQGALVRSITSGAAVYDTLFVELAIRTKCPMVTFDKAVLKAFPEVAVRPGRLTGGVG
jgi:predicted nucleic acid-binding protein